MPSIPSTKLDGTGLTVTDSLITKYQQKLNNLPYDHEIRSDEFSDLFDIPTHISKQGRNRVLGAAFEDFVIDNLEYNSGKIYDEVHHRRELADACVGKYALEIKDRANMNDAKMLRGIKSIGKSLKEKGYQPVALICREDNSDAFLSAASDYLIIQGFEEVCGFISVLNSTQPTNADETTR